MGPGQVVKEEEKEGRRAEREEADTQSGAIHKWMVYVGPGLTQEGRLTLTQPRHLPLLRGLYFLSLSLFGLHLHSWKNWLPSQAQLSHLFKASVLAEIISSATLSSPTFQPTYLILVGAVSESLGCGNYPSFQMRKQTEAQNS